MTALIAAAPAFAAGNYSSGGSSSGSSMNSNMDMGTQNTGATSDTGVNSSTDVKSDTKVNSGASTSLQTRRVITKSNMGLHRCGANRGKGVGNICGLSLTSLDRNGNGSISRSEFRKDKLSSKLFRKIDKNHNGVISQSELNSYNAKQK
jgi:hypothetical protein